MWYELFPFPEGPSADITTHPDAQIILEFKGIITSFVLEIINMFFI